MLLEKFIPPQGKSFAFCGGTFEEFEIVVKYCREFGFKAKDFIFRGHPGCILHLEEKDQREWFQTGEIEGLLNFDFWNYDWGEWPSSVDGKFVVLSRPNNCYHS